MLKPVRYSAGNDGIGNADSDTPVLLSAAAPEFHQPLWAEGLRRVLFDGLTTPP